MKRFLKIVGIVLFVMILASYPTLVIANNIIADNIEKDLKNYDLPENTELVDSLSIAGKYTGNGNGMQYFGTILLKSELSLEEIKAHYKECGNVYVYEQESAELHFLDRPSGHRFKDFGVDDGKCYSVVLWGRIENNFLRGILDCDLRGH